jgi:hypothetical protein
MREINNLRITNGIIYGLSLVGGLLLLYVGMFRGECVDSCGEYYAEYVASPTIIAAGFTAILFSTLVFQIVNLFSIHVEKSHS